MAATIGLSNHDGRGLVCDEQMNIFLAFLTGLTAGGLSCIAVQGGMLMSGIARNVQSEQNAPARAGLLPVTVFLVSKLLAYAVLGALLGWAGSMVQLSPRLQGVLYIAVACFMLGQALNMFEVHPFFRRFVIEPPESVRRFIRTRTKRGGDELFSPALMGGLTVLMPCGITQVIMASALASGSPWLGAALMIAFTLGTSPMFVAMVMLTRKLAGAMHERFVGAMAAIILAMGVLTFNNGLSLAGSPVTLANVFASPQLALPAAPVATSESNFSPAPVTGPTNSAGASADASQPVLIKMEIARGQYVPSLIRAKANTAAKLEIKADSGYS